MSQLETVTNSTGLVLADRGPFSRLVMRFLGAPADGDAAARRIAAQRLEYATLMDDDKQALEGLMIEDAEAQ